MTVPLTLCVREGGKWAGNKNQEMYQEYTRLDTELQNVSQLRVGEGGLREDYEWLPQKLLQGLGPSTFRRD